MRSALLAVLMLLVLWPNRLSAGAWTQDEDHWQIISSVGASQANMQFDGIGVADRPIKFDKLYFKMLAEYGWSNWLTLFIAPEYVIADSTQPFQRPEHANDAAAEAGARLRLTQDWGIISVQASYKVAGPFDLSNSVGHDSAQIAELRFLDGSNFKLFGLNGFVDTEAAQRWVSHPRPSETIIDTTLGLWVRSDTMVMAQSFNTISGGDAEPPYTYYRSQKLELSVVHEVWPGWSIQAGAFFSPAGQNALVEQGITLAVWTRL